MVDLQCRSNYAIQIGSGSAKLPLEREWRGLTSVVQSQLWLVMLDATHTFDIHADCKHSYRESWDKR